MKVVGWGWERDMRAPGKGGIVFHCARYLGPGGGRGDALMESVCSNMEIRETGILLSPLPSSRGSPRSSLSHTHEHFPPPSPPVSCPLILCLFLICGTDILYRHPIGSCVVCHVINQKERKEKTVLCLLSALGPSRRALSFSLTPPLLSPCTCCILLEIFVS